MWYDGSVGDIFYGIAIVNDSSHIIVAENYCNRERHLFVCVAYTYGALAYYGVPFDVVVENNIAVGMEYGGYGVSYAYEHHGQGYHILIQNNIANGCYAGCNIEGTHVVVQNNKFYNCEVAGIILGDAINISFNLIQNNFISVVNPKYFSSSQGYGGILFDPTHVTYANDINITNNYILYDGYPAINCYSIMPFYNCNISDNCIECTNDSSTSYAVVLSASEKLRSNTFCNNKILSCTNGISVYGAGKWVLKDNVIEGNSNGFNALVFAATAASYVLSNFIKNMVNGINGLNSPTIDCACFNFITGHTNWIVTANITVTTNTYNVAG